MPSANLPALLVSLFTREWIEITPKMHRNAMRTVSLFTREWIEIKCHPLLVSDTVSLPLYEGVD